MYCEMRNTKCKIRVTSDEQLRRTPHGGAAKKGLTLMEMTVVIAAVALLTVFGLPAIRTFTNSFESQGSAKPMISAALSSARAIAAKEQHYAGIRFQNRYQGDNDGCQYMVFIVHDQPNTGLANGFRAVEGLEPIKLPDNVGVMEFVGSDAEIYDIEVANKTTFSIVFSPSGKLVIHYVRVRNRNGKPNSDDSSKDDIFNTENNVRNENAMFFQDYGSDGFQEELSRNRFRIYDKSEFDKIDEDSRYDDYLRNLEVIYINPYTGTTIKR